MFSLSKFIVENSSRDRWKQLLPFAVACLLLASVLLRLDWRRFLYEIGHVHAGSFFCFSFLFVLTLLAADSFATLRVYRRTIHIEYRELFALRGAAYLPSILNHHVGQAFLTYCIATIHRTKLARVAGSTALVYASWAACLVVLSVPALVANHRPLGFLFAPFCCALFYGVFLLMRPKRLAKAPFFEPLFEAGVRGHIVAILSRTPHVLILFCGTWLPFRWFSVEIPLRDALQTIPIMMIAVTLPIAPQGFGARDMLAVAFFQQFAVGTTIEQRTAAIAAATLSWGVMLTISQLMISAWFLRTVIPALRVASAISSETEGRIAPEDLG